MSLSPNEIAKKKAKKEEENLKKKEEREAEKKKRKEANIAKSELERKQYLKLKPKVDAGISYLKGDKTFSSKLYCGFFSPYVGKRWATDPQFTLTVLPRVEGDITSYYCGFSVRSTKERGSDKVGIGLATQRAIGVILGEEEKGFVIKCATEGKISEKYLVALLQKKLEMHLITHLKQCESSMINCIYSHSTPFSIKLISMVDLPELLELY